jgi:pimeloyl-ACP methyl ester carboxylesterase
VLLACAIFVIAGILATWAPDRSVQQLSARWALAAIAVHCPCRRHAGASARRRPAWRSSADCVVARNVGQPAHLGWLGPIALTDQRRVIRFDLPAFGLTGPHPDNDYSIAAYVRFVVAVLDQMGVQQFVLAGNSLGGQIAWGTAVAHPQRVKKLVLIDSAGYPLQSTSVPLGFTIARTPGLRVVMEYVLPRGVVQSSVRNVYGDPAKVTADLVDRYYELTLRAGNRQALAYRMDQLHSGDEAAFWVCTRCASWRMAGAHECWHRWGSASGRVFTRCCRCWGLA